jgi:hypothetical protein
MKFRVECSLVGEYLSALCAGWWSGLGTLTTVASLIIGIWEPTFTLPVNRSIWFAIAACAFVSASYFAWRRERLARRLALESALLKSLNRRLDEAILGWETLGEDYQNWPGKEEGNAAILPNPMDPGWVNYGFRAWPYQVGKLQAKTIQIREDLSELGFSLESWDFAHMSMAQLLSALRRYKELIASRK